MAQNDYLHMRIDYIMKDGSFTISGDLNEEGQLEILGNFLRNQIGVGKDESPRNELEKYNVELRWHPEDDRIESYSNIGNKSLRDGILLKVFGELGELEEGVLA